MKTNNENGRRGGDRRPTNGAGREGKSFEKRSFNTPYNGEQSDNKKELPRVIKKGDSSTYSRFDNKKGNRGPIRTFGEHGQKRSDNPFATPRKRFTVSSSEEKGLEQDKTSFKPKSGNFSERKPWERNSEERPRLVKRLDDKFDPNAKYSKKKQLDYKKNSTDPNAPIRLNKYIANSGLCSRREADDYIRAGVVTVNGEVIVEMGHKVLPTDRVLFHDQLVQSEKKVYLLLNKPKDCVTTTEDTHARLTVVDLVKNACSERIYPVGRLDRNTTGVLLLTNDGDLASKLTQPKYNKKKIYQASLDKPLTKADMAKIAEGITLEDGEIRADEIQYVKDEDKKLIGIEIHSGRNRLVRRIFEHLGYKVVRLDRVYFAGLTKKGLTRGKWRFLNEREVNMLRMGAFE